MKKLLITLLLLLPSLAFATPVSWDFAGGILQPLQSAWSAVIKGSYFTATSTTQSSTFPLFTSTNGTTTNASSTNFFATNASTSVFYGAGLTDCDADNQALSWDVTTGKFVCGDDDNSGGGGASDWNQSLGTYLTPSTTVGIRVAASSTIGDGTATGGLTISGAATTTGFLNVNRFSTPVTSLPTLSTLGMHVGVENLNNMALTRFSTGVVAGPTVIGYRADGTAASPTAVVNTDELLEVTGRGYDGTAWSTASDGAVRINAAQNWASGAHGTYIDFSTTLNNTATEATRLRVHNDGKVTVGTTSTSSALLTIAGDIATANLFATGTASSTYASTSALTVYQVFNLPYLSDGCLRTTSGVVSSAACTGGSGGSISTSSIPVAGNLTYWTSPSTVSDVATGTLTETVTGLELSATRGLVGGSAILSLTTGYTVPTTSSTTEWGTFYQTPSTRITDGTGLTWSSNTLNCDTANGSTQGCLTSIDWTSFNNKVSSTSIDTSFELAALLTDEIGTGQLVFNNPSTFSFGSATSSGSSTISSLTVTNGTTTNGTSTNLAVSGSLKLFGGTSVTSNNALCILLTGTADLCDGNDASGGGSALKAHSWYVDADGAGDYTTIQGALDQCAVVGGGSIYLTDPYYFIGGTGLVFKSNDCQVIGIYASTTIEVSGATTAFKTNSAASTYANVGVQNVVIVGDGTAGSVGIDMSDMIRSRYTGIIMDNLDIGFKLDDTQNVSFYNTVRDFAITTMGTYGIYASSTNPTNDNKFSDGFIGCTAGCTGIHLNNAQANSFTNVSIEPATQSGTIGVKIDVSNSAANNGTFANKFTNLYAEANGVGVAASTTIGTKIVLGNTFDGGEIVANGVDVVDSSNGNGAVQFNGAIVNYEIANMFATTTMTFATTTKLKISGSLFDTNGNTGSSGQVLTSTGTSTLWKTVTGGSGSKWTDGTNFTYLTNTTYDLALGSNATETAPFWWDVSATTSYIGNGGAGDSVLTFGPTGSEWTMGFDDTDDSFRISSSTSLGTFDFFKLFSTTTQLSDTSSLTSLLQNKGYRTVINPNGSGYLGRTDFLDEFVVKGRQRNPDWFISDCPNPVGATAIAADGVTGCGGFTFGEQGTETLTAVAGNGYSYAQLGGAVANESAAFALNGATAGFLKFATSTPSMEVTARIGTIVANSSTTKYVIGYSNAPVAAPGTGAEPSVGCFFIASTTVANWLATCRTALGTGTIVDTGVSSTSIATGAGVWRTFRIDADSDNALFYIMDGDTGALNLVADISTTYPGTTALNAGLWWHRTTGTQAIQFDFFGLNVQWRRFIPDL